MKRFAGLLSCTLLALITLSLPATAADMEKGKAEKAAKAEKGKATIKVITENDKVRVQEVIAKPGEVNETVATKSTRVVRAIKGGTLERVYADGKKEKVDWKAGDVRVLEAGGAYTTKNVGKSEVVLYVVIVK